MTAPSPSAAAAAGTWIWGRGPDLLIGCGLGYALLLPFLLWVGAGFERAAWPLLVGAAINHLIAAPHYGATVLRVYERREERRKYAFFSVWVTLALLALMFTSLHVLWLGSLLLTLYVSWSPWHYAGQNYGLSLLFLRHRGVQVPARCKRLLYASFLLSTFMAVLSIHMERPGVSYAGSVVGPANAYRLLSLGVPRDVGEPLLGLAALAYLGCLVAVAVSLRRSAGWRALAPSALLVGTQALWFSVPALAQHFGAAAERAILLASIWVIAAHSLQYLWITSHFARREGTAGRLGTYWVRATLAGALLSFGPALVLAPALFGSLPYDAGLAVLIFSVVNLHHFILDGAIWKLRDGAVARVLLRARPDPGPARARSWVRPAVYAVGALGLAVNLIDVWERAQLVKPDLEVERVRTGVERLAWLGRESPFARTRLAKQLAQRGDDAEAMAEFRRANQLAPTAEAWRGIGLLHERAEELEEAAEAYEAALALEPERRSLRYRAGAAWLELAEGAEVEPSRAAELRARAIPRLEEVLRAEPDHKKAARRLGRAYAHEGRIEEAIALLESAIAIGKAAGERTTAMERDLQKLREQLDAPV